MEQAQLSFIDLMTIRDVETLKPHSPWELMAAGLKAQEMQPITREDVRRAKETRD